MQPRHHQVQPTSGDALSLEKIAETQEPQRDCIQTICQQVITNGSEFAHIRPASLGSKSQGPESLSKND